MNAFLLATALLLQSSDVDLKTLSETEPAIQSCKEESLVAPISVLEPPPEHQVRNETRVRGKSFFDGRNWVLGNPNHVFWLAICAAYVSFRVFHRFSPHHEIGCVAGVATAILFFVLQIVSGVDGNFLMSISVGGLSYSVATVSCWLNQRRTEYAESDRRRTQPEPSKPLSEQLAEIQSDLEHQLQSISESPFDDPTLDDLRETAKQAAVERMARILESN